MRQRFTSNDNIDSFAVGVHALERTSACFMVVLLLDSVVAAAVRSRCEKKRIFAFAVYEVKRALGWR